MARLGIAYLGSGNIRICLTIAEARRASHPGDCYVDVREMSQIPETRAQLDRIGVADLRDALREYGAWTDAELMDHSENKIRALWIAAGDIVQEDGSSWGRGELCDAPEDCHRRENGV